MREADYTALGDVVRPIGGAERDKTALIFDDRILTYDDLDRKSDGVAVMLQRNGVRPGDRVAVLSKNSAALVAILFGVAKVGGVFVPLNWRLSSREVGWIFGDAEPALLFIEHGLERLVDQAATSGVTVIGFEDLGEARFDADGLEGSAPTPVDLTRDDLAMLIYTSGTTGHPKGAMITHGNFVRHCGLDDPSVPTWTGIRRDEVCIVVLPLFHVGGLELLLRPLFTGATVVLHREVDLARILDDIGRYKATMIGLVPTALQMMLDHPASGEVDFASLDKFLYGAAPIPLPLLKQGLERMGCDFVGTYGMTEANGVVAMLSPSDHRGHGGERLTSTGLPTFDAEIKVVDADGRDLPPGEIGELLVRGSGVMKGYWKRPGATEETIDEDGWLRSGDAGYRDADGFVFICDRVKDMICSGGENIYPAEVESAVFGHPAIAEVAVVGVPDAKWGESVLAVVVPRTGVTITPEEVIAWAKSRIASYKVPRSVEIVEALPKNATGKILRREVRDRARRERQFAV